MIFAAVRFGGSLPAVSSTDCTRATRIDREGSAADCIRRGLHASSARLRIRQARDNVRAARRAPPPRAGCGGLHKGRITAGGAPGATGAASGAAGHGQLSACHDHGRHQGGPDYDMSTAELQLVVYVAVSMCIFRRAHDKCNLGHVVSAALWNVVPKKKRHSDIIVKSLFVKVAS